MANPDGTVFVRKDDAGKEIERVAYTPSDMVKLRFDGWTEKKTPKKTAAEAKTPEAKSSDSK